MRKRSRTTIVQFVLILGILRSLKTSAMLCPNLVVIIPTFVVMRRRWLPTTRQFILILTMLPSTKARVISFLSSIAMRRRWLPTIRLFISVLRSFLSIKRKDLRTEMNSLIVGSQRLLIAIELRKEITLAFVEGSIVRIKMNCLVVGSQRLLITTKVGMITTKLGQSIALVFSERSIPRIKTNCTIVVLDRFLIATKDHTYIGFAFQEKSIVGHKINSLRIGFQCLFMMY